MPTSQATATRWNILPALLVSLFAFLLALFPARNADLWAHLQAGRQLAHGDFSSGADSDLPTGLHPGRGWLYDLVLYGLFSVLGGSGLVLAKALLVVGLGLVLLQVSRTDHGWGIAAACTMLALLTMSTRLLVQPATVSYLLLALTLWFLRRPERERAGGLPSPLPPWPLLVVFLIWVNMDGWFVLGLGTAALVWLGRVLDGPPALAGRTPALLQRALSLLILGAVCLVNPLHVRAFVPPPELGWFGIGPATAADFGPQVTSPFQRAYLEYVGRSPAVLAYFPLLGLGTFSFVLNLPRWHWERFLPWLGLALLSALQVRAMPFFAVVAGPLLAWNIQELLARRSRVRGEQSLTWQQAAIVGRTFAWAAGLALLVCAWPGWLQAPPFEPRRWAVEPPPSFVRGAAAIRQWHEQGKLGPGARGLHLAHETAQTFAWFCPEDKGLVDDRLPSTLLGDQPAGADLDQRLRSAGVNHLIVYDRDRGRLSAVLDRLLVEPRRWPLLQLEGDLAIFGWRDPDKADREDPFRGWELDLERLAFHPEEDRKAPRRPERQPEVRRWWEAFWKPAPPPPVDRDKAALHLLHAEALRQTAPFRHLAMWEQSQSAGLVAAAGAWAGPGALADAHLRLVLLRPQMPERGSEMDTLPGLDRMAHVFQRIYTLERDDTPPALLYLAIRAARRALAVNPGDAQAHLILGESYLRLLHATRERAWGERLPQLVQLRLAQASAALNRAIALSPDLAQAHRSLGGLYREMGYLDLALDHLQTYDRLIREAGPRPEDDAERSQEQQALFRQDLDRLAKDVENRDDAYTVESTRSRVLDRAVMALRKGLAAKARGELLESDVSAFGPQGMAMELKLLLTTGRPKDVLEWMQPEQEAALGVSPYHWLRAQAFAASGDYVLAEEECARLTGSDTPEDAASIPARFEKMVALLIGQAVLDEQPGVESVPALAWRAERRAEVGSQLAGLAPRLRQEADATVLRGLLALEEGQTEVAEAAFRLALAMSHNDVLVSPGGGLEFNGLVIAQNCLGWLK